MVRAVLRRPDLWWAALGALRRLAVPGWWHRAPFLPVPDPRLWDFRMVTAYGSADADPESTDVVSYLEWCRSTAGHCSSSRRATGVPGRHLDTIRSG
jgi:hypothetical protein